MLELDAEKRSQLDDDDDDRVHGRMVLRCRGRLGKRCRRPIEGNGQVVHGAAALVGDHQLVVLHVQTERILRVAASDGQVGRRRVRGRFRRVETPRHDVAGVAGSGADGGAGVEGEKACGAATSGKIFG